MAPLRAASVPAIEQGTALLSDHAGPQPCGRGPEYRRRCSFSNLAFRQAILQTGNEASHSDSLSYGVRTMFTRVLAILAVMHATFSLPATAAGYGNSSGEQVVTAETLKTEAARIESAHISLAA